MSQNDNTRGDVDKISSCVVMSQNDNPCLSDLWDLETIGISDPIHVRDDDRALSKFNSTIFIKKEDTSSPGLGDQRKLNCQKTSVLPLEE